MRFSYIMDGCTEELTHKEWNWLTLVLSPTETQRTDHHARDHLALVDGILRALLETAEAGDDL